MNFNLKKILIILTISLVLTEGLLRLIGFKPGYWGKFDGFKTVDSLVVYKNFSTDEYGVFKFSDWVTDSLKKHYNWRTASINPETSTAKLVKPWDQINYIYTSFSKLESQGKEDISAFTKSLLSREGKEDWNTEFTKNYTTIRNKNNLSNLEKAIKKYVINPFNQDGFRSIAFKQHNSCQPRILLLGDSFAYGMSARPFFNSYADIMLARGYEIYNTGMPGVDPAQYAAVAKEYVSQLKPDLVILNFSDGEDLMNFPRELEQAKPHEHATNAGFINSYPLGKYLAPNEAYKYYLSLTKIPSDGNFLNIACSYFTISSLVWGKLYRLGYLNHALLNTYYNFETNFTIKETTAITKYYIDIIDSVCQANHVKLINIVLPDKTASYNQGTKYVNIDKDWAVRLFLNNYYHPENMLMEEDYYQHEDHFNNQGSLKFADYLESIIKRNLESE